MFDQVPSSDGPLQPGNTPVPGGAPVPDRVPDGAPDPEGAPTSLDGSSFGQASRQAAGRDVRTLDERVAAMVKTVDGEISRAGMTSGKYAELVFRAARSEGILQGDYSFENAGKVGRLIYRLEQKLGTQDFKGIEFDYVAKKISALDAPARADLAAFDDFARAVRARLDSEIGRSQVDVKRFEACVISAVDQWVEANCSESSEARSSSFRRAGLHGRMIGRNQSDFDVVKIKRGWDSDLDAAFGKI